MQAQAMLGSVTYEPERLSKLYNAFDRAWEIVSPQVTGTPETIEAARLKLAEILLNLASNNGVDEVALADMAAQMMVAEPTKLQRKKAGNAQRPFS